MKSYPSIAHHKDHSGDFYVFNKLDGSNIRAEWSKKKGFWKFGSRNRLLDETHPMLGESKGLIISNWEKELTDILKQHGYDKVVCFFEYWGENSSFGQHIKEEEHQCSLIDVDIFKQGILPPKEFINLFGKLNIASLLYSGNINEDLVQSVKNSTLEGMTFEGVVCKSTERKKRFSKPIMFKIKSQSWINELKKHCKDDEILFNKLF